MSNIIKADQVNYQDSRELQTQALEREIETLKNIYAAMCKRTVDLQAREKELEDLLATARQEIERLRNESNPDEQECRVCGCTWLMGCPEGCYWVEEDLCSACREVEEETD